MSPTTVLENSHCRLAARQGPLSGYKSPEGPPGRALSSNWFTQADPTPQVQQPTRQSLSLKENRPLPARIPSFSNRRKTISKKKRTHTFSPIRKGLPKGKHPVTQKHGDEKTNRPPQKIQSRGESLLGMKNLYASHRWNPIR